MTDYELAAILLAAEEGEASQEGFEAWREHWLKALPFGAEGAERGEHYGDCIKVPMTCHRCLHDETMRQVGFVRKALAPVIGPPPCSCRPRALYAVLQGGFCPDCMGQVR